ncbi:PIN domain-containing protein [Treponema porcinum]|uniref:type II toxin-antitoxin system VapC family toxin n=1 Tax=Treponema porcinum TaxID=261392 RepID=UPI00240A18C6|nr:PIN domain-containing protein [Treponema porcinum]MDD6899578.1 PIN domain-containing protein [Treponema porcinum]
MNKIFVDTDVILDLLARRIPHFHFSAVLFTFAEMKKLELYTTPLIIANTFYILRKQLGNDSAKNALRKLRILLHVIDSTESIIDKALNSDFSDFEDAIQYYTALEYGIPVILTRNIRDYKKASIVVQTPESYLVTRKLI